MKNQRNSRRSGGGSRPQKNAQSQQRQNNRNDSSEPSLPKGSRLITGTHAVKEALDVHPRKIQQMWLQGGWESSADLRECADSATKYKIPMQVQAKGFLDKNCPSHQGAVLITTFVPEADWQKIYKKDQSKVVFLDGIEDPHNLGAILRTSWLTNVDAVTIPEDRAVGLTPAVHKVACGGVEHVPVERDNNFANHIEALKENQFWVFGLSHKATKTIFDLKIPDKVVWCIGAEDKGLRSSTERLCDELVSLPQASANASYNASIATAIALMETLRQQKNR